MRLISVVTIGLLTVPLLAAAKSPTPMEVLQSDAALVQSLFQRESVSQQHQNDERGWAESTEFLPTMGGEIPLTTQQKNMLKRCERQTTQSRRCEVLKCRLLGECRSR